MENLKNDQENEEDDEKGSSRTKHKIKWDYKDLFTWEGIKRVFLLGGVFWLFYYLNRNTAMFNRIFFNYYINV